MNDRAVDGLRELEERPDGFAYDYRMLSGCGKTATLTAAEYFAETDNARMDCAPCGGRIHSGPAVAALRDEDDPALRDECVPMLCVVLHRARLRIGWREWTPSDAVRTLLRLDNSNPDAGRR